jgi:hypothetical protein
LVSFILKQVLIFSKCILLNRLEFGFVCDWHNHKKGNDFPYAPDSKVCCCETPGSNECNWLVCPDCFVTSTYDIACSFQMCLRQEGFTPLIVAAKMGYANIVQLLLENGASVDVADPVRCVLHI